MAVPRTKTVPFDQWPAFARERWEALDEAAPAAFATAEDPLAALMAAAVGAVACAAVEPAEERLFSRSKHNSLKPPAEWRRSTRAVNAAAYGAWLCAMRAVGLPDDVAPTSLPSMQAAMRGTSLPRFVSSSQVRRAAG
jgi:hypothetical protein